MYGCLGISPDTVKFVNDCEKELTKEFKKIEEAENYNSLKVLAAFHKNKVTESCFNATTGYGYNDTGRDVIEDVYKDVLDAEDALVRGQFISGSHALTVCLFALLRPNDLLLSITGKPYDTLDEVIGLVPNPSSLESYGVNYAQIDLLNDDFDYKKIETYLKKHKVKVIEIQRSKGYSTRKSIDLKKVGKVIKLIKTIDKDIIVMVDNCYCEFVSSSEPTSVGADIMVGSLIKNLGGGIAPNGAYIAGRFDLVKLCADRLTLPGESKEVGPTLGMNKLILQGLFMAPSVVASALKTAVLASFCLAKLGYKVEPTYNEERVDIVENIVFNILIN
jgi:cystathionine beta-lyase family protein involved in aluminum resistance